MENVDVYDPMIGKVFTRVFNKGDEFLVFEIDGKAEFIFYHDQDCCESVYIEDIVGDLEDLVGSPLLESEEFTRDGSDEYNSITYTYYRFATLKGSVSIRWMGQSNGYYSERVDLTTPEDEFHYPRAISEIYGGTNETSNANYF